MTRLRGDAHACTYTRVHYGDDMEHCLQNERGELTQREPSRAISLLLPLPLMRYHSTSRTLFLLSRPSLPCISLVRSTSPQVFLSRVRALALAERTSLYICVTTRVQLNYLSRFHDARTPKISGCMRDARQKGPRANRS